MENKFLTKNTKITIKEEAPPMGLKTAKKVHDENGKINKKALSDFAKKLKDYYMPDESDEYTLEDPLKVDGDDEVGDDDINIYDIEALGAGKMLGLKYDSEGSEVYDKFEKRIDDLNDTSEYDKEFGTKDGFGETDEKDETYKKMKDASEEYLKYKEYGSQTKPIRITDAKKPPVKESKDNKKKKMKRLNFKNEFTTEYEMKELIPENYKTDGHTFLMTDGNQTYKVRWDESLKEGTILGYKNKTQINEDMEKMKKLYNYKYSDSQSPTNDYITETETLKTLLESVKDKDLLGE